MSITRRSLTDTHAAAASRGLSGDGKGGMVEQGHDVDTDARVDDPRAPVDQAPTGATTLADRLLDGAWAPAILATTTRAWSAS
jgi:hypothetical protein